MCLFNGLFLSYHIGEDLAPALTPARAPALAFARALAPTPASALAVTSLIRNRLYKAGMSSGGFPESELALSLGV